MDVTIHHIHTVELGGSAMLAVILILGVLAFCALYPMLMSPVLSSEPPAASPKGPMGFRLSGK